jgi:hypothetical protein
MHTLLLVLVRIKGKYYDDLILKLVTNVMKIVEGAEVEVSGHKDDEDVPA